MGGCCPLTPAFFFFIRIALIYKYNKLLSIVELSYGAKVGGAEVGGAKVGGAEVGGAKVGGAEVGGNLL